MIRKYLQKDQPRAIELFRGNTPKFFSPREENDFKFYLENEIEDYYVYEKDMQIIGVGGINYFQGGSSASISWDIMHPEYHGKGIGKHLVEHRLNHLRGTGQIKEVIVRTSQQTYKFYEKMGFLLEEIEKDYWAPDFDLYQMRLDWIN